MKKNLVRSLGILGLAVLLFGCSSQQRQEQKKAEQPHSAKKAASASKKTAKAASSASSASSSASTNKSGSDDRGFKQSPFPPKMQGTWYGWDQYENKLKTISFSGNKFTLDGQAKYAYDGSVRTSEDQAALNDPSQKMDREKQDKWVALSGSSLTEKPISQDGAPVQVINLLGWYQSAGAGTSYYVTQVQVNGQQTPVLTEAGGAGIWVQMHYYRSQSLALAQKDAGIPTDINQDDNY